jgi:hypothetical protein
VVFAALWVQYGPFVLDGFGSVASIQHGPDGAALPYFSRVPDGNPSCAGVDFFAQALTPARGGVYLYPPFVMAEAGLRFARACGLAGVLVVADRAQPLPAWLADTAWSTRTPLATNACLIRGPHGWEVFRRAPRLVAVGFDYSKSD